MELERRFEMDLPEVVVDQDKIQQVIMNLCQNAVEAMSEGGRLTLSTYRDGLMVILDVADTGVGVPEGLDLFEPFVTSKSDGTGLGLAIARQIALAHGGSLNLVPTEAGAMFRLALPSRPAA